MIEKGYPTADCKVSNGDLTAGRKVPTTLLAQHIERSFIAQRRKKRMGGRRASISGPAVPKTACFLPQICKLDIKKLESLFNRQLMQRACKFVNSPKPDKKAISVLLKIREVTHESRASIEAKNFRAKKD